VPALERDHGMPCLKLKQPPAGADGSWVSFRGKGSVELRQSPEWLRLPALPVDPAGRVWFAGPMPTPAQSITRSPVMCGQQIGRLSAWNVQIGRYRLE
jgi:hypothetical protein